MAKISINWLAAIGFSFAAAVASASPITLTVDPEVVNRGWTKGPFELNFSFGQQLHGVRLEGQTISHDFVFADNILARMLGATGGYAFDALLHLQTDADSWIGYFGAASTGFLLDADGAPLPGPYDWTVPQSRKLSDVRCPLRARSAGYRAHGHGWLRSDRVAC
jgi:hypothetical protein